jgi:hypothetical protein
VTSVTSPLTITIYDKAFIRRGWIGDPEAVEVHPRHNVQPTATITVAADHVYAPALLADGARATITYAGQQLMSGPLRAKAGTSGPDSTLTVTVEDDWRLLSRVLGWPNPTGAITAQGVATAYDTKTGPAETVAKWFIGRAATRLGLPVTIAPDLGRGGTISVQMRMTPLADKLLPLIDQAGIGITVRQVGAGLVVDAYEPSWYPRDLTAASNVVQEWEWDTKGPSVTRTVIGGQGEGTAREFRVLTDTTLETAWGDKIEVFTDARDTAVTTEQDAAGAQALADGAPTAGLKLTFAETASFKYGTSVRVGDLVTTVLVPGAPPITDVLREAVLSWTVADGFSATPVVGDRSDDPNRTFARAISALAKAIRNQRSST